MNMVISLHFYTAFHQIIIIWKYGILSEGQTFKISQNMIYLVINWIGILVYKQNIVIERLNGL